MNDTVIAPLRERVVALALKSFYFASVVRGRTAEGMIGLIALMTGRTMSALIVNGSSRISVSAVLHELKE